MKWNNLKGIRNQYLLFIGTVAITIFIGQAFIHYDINKQNEDARLISLAGNQATLSQRIAKRVLYLQNDIQEKRSIQAKDLDTLKRTVDHWNKVHQSLLKGSDEFGLSDRRSAKVDSILSQLHPHINAIVSAAHQIYYHPDDETVHKATATVQQHERKALNLISKLVSAYQTEAETKLRQLKMVELLLAFLSIAILILEFNYVFVPVLRNSARMNKELANLNQELNATHEELRSNLDYLSSLKTKLESSEKHFRELVENANDMIYELDAGGTFSFVNPKTIYLTGYSGEELLQKKYWDIIDPSYVESSLEFYKKQREKKQVYSYCELLIRSKTGKKIWVGQNVHMHFNNEWVEKVTVIARDISELKAAQQKVAESEDLYRLISTNARDIITVYNTDPDPKRLFVSPSVKDILGYEPDELIGKSAYDIVLQEDVKFIREKVQPQTMAGKPMNIEYRVLKKDGTIVWLQSNSNPHFDKHGNLIGFQTSARDITHIKRAQQALKASELRYRSLSDNAPVGIFETDAEGNTVYVNKMWLEIAGASPEAAMGSGWIQSLHPDDRNRVLDTWEKIMAGEDKLEIEFRFINPKKGVRWVGGRATKVVENGKIAGFIGTLTDITDLKMAQQKLQESENLYRQLSENSQDLTSLNDPDGSYVYLSHSAKQLLGYEPDELTGTSPQAIIHPDDIHVYKRSLRLTLQGNSVQHIEYRIRRKDGRHVWLDSHTQPIFDKNGNMTSFQTTSRDITLRKGFELALQEAKDQAEEATKAKSQFLSMMSHEIRTPMNAIIGLTNLLIQEKPREDQTESLKLLKFSGENLLTIINDILDFSKIEAGKIVLENISFNLRATLDNTVQMLEQRASDRELQIFFKYDNEVPDFIKGDQVRITQIITNLLGNAIKFTEKGYVELAVNLLKKENDKYTIEFSVKDTGIGIEPDKLKLIFDSFSQANSDTTRKFGGTGLGLSITKRLLTLMNSEIKLQSSVGFGSTFSFVLTLKKGSVTENGHTVYRDLGEDFKKHSIRILLVEDNRVNQIVASNFLKKWNLMVDIANNGKEAVVMIENKSYNLVLMDLQMPEMDGYEAAEKIRQMDQDPYFKNIPIIALTASAMIDIKDKVINFGMNDFISKPFQPEELQNKIARYVLQELPQQESPRKSSNLDLYSEGDNEFKRELATLLIKNIEELIRSLEDSIQQKDPGNYARTVHKVKTTLTMLGDIEFTGRVNEILVKLDNNQFSEALTKEVQSFRELSLRIIEGLHEEIKSF